MHDVTGLLENDIHVTINPHVADANICSHSIVIQEVAQTFRKTALDIAFRNIVAAMANAFGNA